MTSLPDEKAAWVLRVLGVAIPTVDVEGLSKTLAALLHRIPEAVAANPGAKDRLVTLAQAARDALKGPAPAAAAANIEALRLALDAAAKPAPAGDANAPATVAAQEARGENETPEGETGEGETGEDEAPELGELSARLNAVRERCAALAHPEGFIDDALAANAALDRNDAATAGGLIDSLEARLLSAERAQAAAEEIEDAKAIPGVGAVQLAKLRLQLRALESGRGLAISQLQAACRDVMTSGDPEDPRLEEGLAALADLAERVPAPSPDLSAAIDAMADTADKAKQTAGRDTALREIKRYRATLDAEPMLKTLESTPVGNYRIYGQMVESLSALENALSH